MLAKFVEAVLALLVAYSTNAGNSPYSFQLVPGCGTQEKAPTCQIIPTCAVPDAWRCAPPRWSDARGGWVVPESREIALRRYRGIAESISRVAFMQARCRDEHGSVIERCTPAAWPEGPESLARVAATTAIWESGLREDIQHGYPPMGRGPDGEVCLVQVMPSQISKYASWIPAEEKKEWSRSNVIRRREIEEGWAAQMLGDRPEALDKCFETGLRALAHCRAACRSKMGISWMHGMWAMYGTGNACSVHGGSADGKSFAEKREGTYLKMRAHKDGLTDEVRMIVGLPKPTS